MKRIDVTKLAPITPAMLKTWTASSWRSDAFDPAYDYYEPEVAPRRKVHGQSPAAVLADGTKVYPAFFDDISIGLYHDLDNWA